MIVDGGAFTFFGQPDAVAVPLKEKPRLESWDAKAHPSQIELDRYLRDIKDLVGEQVSAAEPPRGVLLSVGVPGDQSLTSGGGDLDNYLFPVVYHLGPSRFDTAWVQKDRGSSTITVGPARPTSAPEEGWKACEMVTTSSATTRAFKEEIDAQVPTGVVGTGPIEMQIAYRLAEARNWATVWKPTIDALGGVLGLPNPAHPFAPNDDRIVRLGLHRTIDPSLGWNIAIKICWRPAPTA